MIPIYDSTMEPIVTPRLRGLPIAESDFDDLCALHRDRRVLPTGVEPLTNDETCEWLDWRLGHWREHGFGVWMFRDENDAFVGRCGIHEWSLEGQPEVEIGYIVRADLWSQGYATEMGHAVVGHAFSTLAMHSLVGFTRPGNLGSRRVLEKLGFTYERSFVVDDQESVLYRRVNDE